MAIKQLSRCALISALAAIAISPNAMAQSMKMAIGDDPNATPAMDNPPIPWFNYWMDHLGRSTFLPADCLFSKDKSYVEKCVPQAIIDHRIFIQVHDNNVAADARREAFRQQLAQEEAAQNAAEEKQRRVEEAQRAAQQAQEQREADKRARIEAIRAAHDPRPYSREIHAQKARLAYYHQMLARENRVGSISGYVNIYTEHQLGEMIVTTEDQIAGEYRLYLSHGGRLPLSAL